jgi:hypothetical protein
MIYKFYRFLPGLEDIYQELRETPKWRGIFQASASSKAGAEADPGTDFICSHVTAIFKWR